MYLYSLSPCPALSHTQKQTMLAAAAKEARRERIHTHTHTHSIRARNKYIRKHKKAACHLHILGGMAPSLDKNNSHYGYKAIPARAGRRRKVVGTPATLLDLLDDRVQRETALTIQQQNLWTQNQPCYPPTPSPLSRTGPQGTTL